jgi:hypothetical protein
MIILRMKKKLSKECLDLVMIVVLLIFHNSFYKRLSTDKESPQSLRSKSSNRENLPLFADRFQISEEIFCAFFDFKSQLQILKKISELSYVFIENIRVSLIRFELKFILIEHDITKLTTFR